MPSHMKLSDAIMLNGMTKPQGFGANSVHSVDAPCAIGGALQVIGKQDSVIPYSVFEIEWPWAKQRIHYCPQCVLAGTVTQTIFHLNDLHRWTRQQIAEWVKRIEPTEIMPERLLPSEDDPAPSAGNCLKHGSYNGRLLRCPLCHPTTCQAADMQNCEDQYGELCGKKCDPGKDYCEAHHEE